MKARTAQANQIRGLLGEFGIVIPQGVTHIAKRLPSILEDADHDLPGMFRDLLARLGSHLGSLSRQAEELEREIQAWHRQSEASCRLAEFPGIGPITASALTASIGDASCFKNGRQLAAFLGLVPKQHSSGGRSTLLGISKRGDVYLRTLLIHGARAKGLRVKKGLPKQRHDTRVVSLVPGGFVSGFIRNRDPQVMQGIIGGLEYRIGIWSLGKDGLMIESIPDWLFLWFAFDLFVKLHCGSCAWITPYHTATSV